MNGYLRPVPKERPRALDKRDRAAEADRYYREQRAIALARDGKRCRLCGSEKFVETHHCKRRSSFGPKETLRKHHHANLLTLCGGPDDNSCHTLETQHVLKVEALTERGTNGPVGAWKWSDGEWGYVEVRSFA